MGKFKAKVSAFRIHNPTVHGTRILTIFGDNFEEAARRLKRSMGRMNLKVTKIVRVKYGKSSIW